MAEPMNIFLGFDPGGGGKPKEKGKFGWSICREVGGQLERVTTGLAKEAWDALSQVKNELERYNRQSNARVFAAGIDAPLFWTRTGKRTVDDFIKQESGIRPLPIASLYGAAAVQGPLLARHISDTWDSLPITESYPRVLEYLLVHTGKYQAEHKMVKRLTEGLNATPGQNHERDATLCAVSAWATIRQPANWQNLYLREPGPITPFDIPVSYWMPIA